MQFQKLQLLLHMFKSWENWTVKRKRKIVKFTTKLTVLWYDKKPSSLESNDMAAIPKNYNKKLKRC